MINKKRFFMALVACSLSATLWAQGPNDTGTYYQAADGKSGAELKTALCNIINPHVQRTYAQLWTDFGQTDLRDDGYIWDMYSGVTNYTLGTDQNKGSMSGEGDNYNREHSMPNSWFNKDYPPYTDLYHMYPTDSYVNNRRGNEPFGETTAPTYQSRNNFSKMGPARAGLGYSGTVFEPNDEYKGDFARTYFYMVTCYETYTDASGNQKHVSGWNSPMLAQNQYPALTDWAVQLLLRWSADDPISQKETKRQEAVWQIQQNRNPFIDYPGLEQYIWGTKTAEPFSYDHYVAGIGSIVDDVDEAATAVYTLSGLRVDVRPLPKGIYVKRAQHAKKARKIVVK